MSGYQSIEIKKDEVSAFRKEKETSWKSLLLLGLVVFAGIVLLSSYSGEKENKINMDELVLDESAQDLSFTQHGIENLADEMEGLDLTDLSQVLSTLAKHGALDITDLGLTTTSSERVDAVRKALTDIIAKLNAEKAAVKADYDKREQERLAVKAKANKAAADANNVQLAKKQTYDNLKKIADDGVATYNKENAEDKKETDQLVADLNGVIAQVDRLTGYVPNVNCQVNEDTDFTLSGWNIARGRGKVHGYFDAYSKVVGKTFTGLKSTTNKVQVSFRLVYANTPDGEPIFVNINGQRVYNSVANSAAPQLPAAERATYYPGITNAWYRDIKLVYALPANGQIRVDIAVLLNERWANEGWFFDNFKICDYGEPSQ